MGLKPGGPGAGGLLPAPNAPGDYLQANQALGWSAVPPAQWATQATWFVDSVAGSDLNTGLTAPTALKTLGNLALRISGQTLLQNTTITLSGDFSTEDIALAVGMAAAKQLVIDGGLTQVATGALTGVTAINRATNQALTLTDALVADWTPFLGMFLVIDGGPRNGAICVIDKNLGAGAMRAAGMNSLVESTGAMALVTPVVGDAYKVYKPATKVRSLQFQVSRDYDSVGFTVSAIVKGIEFNGNEATSLVAANDTGTLEVARCTFASDAIEHAAALFAACNFSSSNNFLELIAIPSVQALPSGIYGCRTVPATALGGNLSPDFDTLGRGTISILRGGATAIGNVSVYDAVGSGFFLHRSANAVPTATVYGSGNTRYGFEMQSGTGVFYSTKPTITGALGDVLLAGTIVAYANVPAKLLSAKIMATTETLGAIGSSVVVNRTTQLLVYGDNRDQLFFSASTAGGAATPTPRFLYAVAYTTAGAIGIASEKLTAMLMARPGKVVAAYSDYLGATIPTNTIYTVRKNGVDTAVTWTVLANVEAGSDTAHSFTFAAGEWLTVQSVTTLADSSTSYPNVTLLVEWV